MPVKNMTFVSLFKILVWSQICLWVLLILFLGVVASMVPGVVVIYDGEAGNMMEALRSLPILFGVGAAFILLVGSLGAVGLKLFGEILPLGTVSFREQG